MSDTQPEITTTITLGKTQVPVVVTLLGAGTLGEPDRNGYIEPVTVGRVMSAGYFDREHHAVNGVPLRFDASVERTQNGFRLAHMTAYRVDRDYGMGEITATVRSHIYKAAPALVESLLADPANAHDAEVARAERAVDRAAYAAQKAREAATEAAVALAAAEERLAALKGAHAPA